MVKPERSGADGGPRGWYQAHRAVLAFLRSNARSLSEDDRDDLASEVMEALLVKQTQEEIKDLSAFAVAIAKGKLLNAVRKRERQATAPVADLDNAEPSRSSDEAAAPRSSKTSTLLDRRALRGIAIARAFVIMHELGASIPALSRDEQDPVVDGIVERLDAAWRAWTGEGPSEVRLGILNALEFAAQNYPDHDQEDHVGNDLDDPGGFENDLDPNNEAATEEVETPAVPTDDPEADREGERVALFREYLETIGRWDLVRALPYDAIRMAVKAWRRRAGERGPLRKFEGASLLLRWAGDVESGTSPEALRKSWQRLLKIEQGRSRVDDDDDDDNDEQAEDRSDAADYRRIASR